MGSKSSSWNDYSRYEFFQPENAGRATVITPVHVIRVRTEWAHLEPITGGQVSTAGPTNATERNKNIVTVATACGKPEPLKNVTCTLTVIVFDFARATGLLNNRMTMSTTTTVTFGTTTEEYAKNFCK